eukprot:364659-Chlamydomonas_euryale.AAC.3
MMMHWKDPKAQYSRKGQQPACTRSRAIRGGRAQRCFLRARARPWPKPRPEPKPPPRGALDLPRCRSARGPCGFREKALRVGWARRTARQLQSGPLQATAAPKMRGGRRSGPCARNTARDGRCILRVACNAWDGA